MGGAQLELAKKARHSNNPLMDINDPEHHHQFTEWPLRAGE